MDTYEKMIDKMIDKIWQFKYINCSVRIVNKEIYYVNLLYIYSTWHGGIQNSN